MGSPSILQTLLRGNKNASNIACRAELGRFPLNITINQKNCQLFSLKMIKQSFNLHCNGKNSFRSHLMNMSKYFNLPDFNPDLLDTIMVKSYVRSMKQEYTSYWQYILQHSQKLEFYRSFKTDQTTSN